LAAGAAGCIELLLPQVAARGCIELSQLQVAARGMRPVTAGGLIPYS